MNRLSILMVALVAAAVIGDVPAELRPNALDVVGSALLSSERALAYVQLGLPDGGWVRADNSVIVARIEHDI